jgi:hypothetical protein
MELIIVMGMGMVTVMGCELKSQTVRIDNQYISERL